MKTAILVDGGFYLKRYMRLYSKQSGSEPRDAVIFLNKLVQGHMARLNEKDSGNRELYRVFFYDCPPILKKAHLPISNKAIDFSKTKQAQFRLCLHEELKKQRKVALRLGHLSNHGSWEIRPGKLKQVLQGKLRFEDLTDKDFNLGVRQKGVDMKIGLDIASLSYKRLVDRIILISGDADFVSAAKLARREGMDFILDPLWHPIDPSLNEHIDGLQSVSSRPK